MKGKKYSYIDLFAGAGGLSEGFLVNGNFFPAAHIEMNKDACDTLKTRVCYYYLRENNIIEVYERYQKGEISRHELYNYVPDRLLKAIINKEISEESIQNIFDKVDDIFRKEEVRELDLIIGGPPCQAYSLVGRAVSADNMAKDPRNFLYKQYIKFLQHYQPKMFVFENVPGILTAQKGETFKTILSEFEKAGYKVDYKILNSSDFGVLQNRRRVIIMGWKNNYKLKYPNFENSNFDLEAKVFDILSDLAPLKRGEEKNEYISEVNEYLRVTGMRSEKDILTHHICRNHNKKDLEIYRRVILAWNDNHKRVRYTELPEKLRTHKNQTSFLDRYKVIAGDVKCSHTMIAHIAKDGHYFIHPDIKQCRSISVREAARIQSFPDNYFFEGSRAAKYVQIGNAVPPLMARGLASEIENMLEDIYNEKTI